MNIKEVFDWFAIAYVPILAGILTIFAMQLIKIVYKKRGKLYSGMPREDRDRILSKTGTWVAWATFAVVMVVDMIIRRVDFKPSSEFIYDGLIKIGTGATITWAISKAIYTGWRQRVKGENRVATLQDTLTIIKDAAEAAVKTGQALNPASVLEAAEDIYIKEYDITETEKHID